MNKLKLDQLKNIKQCPFKAYISQFDFKTLSNKAAMIQKVYKNILCDYDFLNLSKIQLKALINEQLDDTYFLTNQEKEIEAITILNYLLRYIEYEKSLNRKILRRNVYDCVQIGNVEIEIKADVVFENKGSIELVNYKTNATKLSYKARTDKNLPKNNMELYLLQKLGEKLFLNYNKPIKSSFYHLKGKNENKVVYEQFMKDKSVLISKLNEIEFIKCEDKKEQKLIDKQIKNIKNVLYFNNTKGNNIITFDYNNDLSDEIIKLVNTNLDFNSEKCKSSDCDFCNYSTLCTHEYTNDDNELEVVKELKKANSEVKLTNAQKQVINIYNGIYRINACAGSGKSFSMVMRTIEMFKKGYKPNDMLMITFTNKGAEELKEKIAYWLNYYKIQNIRLQDLNIFTFNGFGDSIISNEWAKLGFKKQPQLATTIDINDIIKEILAECDTIEWLNYKNPLLNYPNAKGAFKQLLIYFNLIKSFDYNVDSLIENVLLKEKDNLNIEELKAKSLLIFKLYDKFCMKLKEKNLLQYQDQVLYLIELFEKYPNLINVYGFKHIIVDEYQDTDFTQVKLLHLLEKYKNFKSLMVVGDTDQNIYGFRNTTPKNMLNFEKDFKNVTDIFLLENFRSTPQICKLANELIKLNEQRIDKNIISKKDEGLTPQLLKFETLNVENENIVNLIKQKIKQGIPKHEICYIARTKKELLEIQRLLNDAAIPNVIDASELYLNNTNVQCIINLANFFRNMELDYYLMEYKALTDINCFKDVSIEDNKQMIENIKTMVLQNFVEMNEKETDNIEELKIQSFNNAISPIIKSDKVAKSFMDNINTKKFQTFNQLLNYLYKIALYKDDTSINREDVKYNAIMLTTAHSSKGKEWSVVINSINNYKYIEIINNLDLLEEERRLLFVSITRAKNELFITYNTNNDKIRNKGVYCLFVDEIQNIIKK